AIVAAISAAPCAASLHALTLDARWTGNRELPAVDVSTLRLRRLFVKGVAMRLVLGAAAARMQSLFVTPVDSSDLAALIAQPLPELRDLGIAVGQVVPRRGDAAALDAVFDGATT